MNGFKGDWLETSKKLLFSVNNASEKKQKMERSVSLSGPGEPIFSIRPRFQETDNRFSDPKKQIPVCQPIPEKEPQFHMHRKGVVLSGASSPGNGKKNPRLAGFSKTGKALSFQYAVPLSTGNCVSILSFEKKKRRTDQLCPQFCSADSQVYPYQ
jgi:acyl-CoA thioesterase